MPGRPNGLRLSGARKGVRCSRGLGGHVKFVVEELRREIGAVRPRDCAQVWRKDEAAKVPRIAEWLKHRSAKLCRQVDLSFRPIFEFEPERVISNVTSFHYVNHLSTPTARSLWVDAPP